MGEVNDQGNIVHSVSNWCTSFLLHINRMKYFRDMSNRVLTLKNHIRNFWRKFTCRTSPKSNQIISMPRGYNHHALWWLDVWFSLYCSDKHFFVYQCHSRDFGSRSPKCHPVHFPDLYFLCPKYLRFSSINFDIRSKSHRGGVRGCRRRRGRRRGHGNELETLSHPRPGWLNYTYHSVWCQITSHQLSRNGLSYRRRVLCNDNTAHPKPLWYANLR